MKDKSKLIATFRFALISPSIHMSSKERREYFHSLSEKEFEVPYLGLKRYKAGTFKQWLLNYRNGGLENLEPTLRSDAGKAKRIKEKTAEIIKQIIDDYPYISISGIYRMLLKEGLIMRGEFGETTLRNYIKKHDLNKNIISKQERKKFEKFNINELWTADFMDGPYLNEGKKKRKAYLCAIIDDHSRIITGAGWYFRKNVTAFALTLKKAISVYGLPDVLYTDNGSCFKNNYIYQVCARLGIALIHSRPYDSASRGKIERFIRTVRQKFLSAVNISAIKDIDKLNELFNTWLDKDYHRQYHHGINTKPIDRYIANASKIKLRTLPYNELSEFFLNTITRKVKNDATISVTGKIYEVPVEFIGKVVQLCFPIDEPEKIYIYENGKAVALIREVNLSINATKPYTGIHFKKLNKIK